MLKKFIFIFKKIIIGMMILFGYNTFLSSINVMIPINVVTIIITSFLDVPGMIGLILFYIINF